MLRATVRKGVEIAYEDDRYGPPWSESEAALLVHGVAESSRAWLQWVPLLGARLRLIRPDLPGFGRSPFPMGYGCTPADYAGDLVRLLDALAIDHVHLVAAKYGGMVAMQLTSARPERVRSLSVFSSPVGPQSAEDGREPLEGIEVREWAARSQRRRLGAGASDAQLKWWTEELMGPSDRRAVIGCQMAMRTNSVRGELSRITAPTVIVTTEEGSLQAVEEVRAYQRQIVGSRLVVLPGDAYHPAAVQPSECAAAVLELIDSLAPSPDGGGAVLGRK